MQQSPRVPQPFPWRIFLRTFAVQLAVLLVALVASGLLARSFFEKQLLSQDERDIEAALNISANLLDKVSPESWCAVSAKETQYRVTLMNLEGAVICDSHHSVNDMGSHADRPEVSDAIGTGRGLSIRHSTTVGFDMFYLAKTAANGANILRFALPLSDLNRALSEFDRALIIAMIVIAILLTVGEIWIARVFVQPIRSLLVRAEVALGSQENGLSLSELGRSTWGEWEHLDSVIESLRRELRTKIETLKREKAEQAVIMESISDAILVVGSANRVIFVNERFRALFPDVDVAGGQDIRTLCREPVLIDLLDGVIRDAARNRVATLKFDMAQATRYFALSASALLRHDARAYGAVVVFHDVTDLKLAEKMRIDFVSNVSHEIRTPLASIKGFATTALSDLKSGVTPTLDIVEPIVRNSERMVKIVADLLELSTLDSTVITEVEQVDCREISERVAASFQPLLDERGQEIVIQPTDLTVHVDVLRLEQVLTNLIDNASKYIPQGGRIEVAWQERPNQIVLSVADNGPGIEERHLPRLFERFYRVDKGRSRNQGGTGLGLAIVKHIMLAHGGHVAVESHLNAGTTFRCLFPKRG